MYLHLAASTTTFFQNRQRRDRTNPLLFAGLLGTSKTTTIKAFIAEENCTKNFKPFATGEDHLDMCGCANCVRIRMGRSVDLLTLDGDATADEFSDVVTDFAYRPPKELHARYLLLRHIHLAPPSVTDRLLKVIEEPPPDLRVYLTTSNLPAVRGSLVSRCQSLEQPPTTPEKLRELAKHVPALQGLTTALKSRDFYSTREPLVFVAGRFPYHFQLLCRDVTTPASLKETAKSVYAQLGQLQDMPAAEARLLFLRYCLDAFQSYLYEAFDAVSDQNNFRPAEADARLHELQGILGQQGIFALIRKAGAQQYINLEQQFVSFFLGLLLARKIANLA